MICEILTGLTRDDLTSELSALKAALRESEASLAKKTSLCSAYLDELRDYAATVQRLNAINEQLARENNALREAAELLMSQ